MDAIDENQPVIWTDENRLNDDTSDQTIIWSSTVEKDDFIKVPRTLTRLARYSEYASTKIQPRHIVLLLALAGRQFKSNPIRSRWRDLATDLGTKPDTVRKWAYELRDLKLLNIRRAPGPDDTATGWKTFDLTPFVKLVQDAYIERRNDRNDRLDRLSKRPRSPT